MKTYCVFQAVNNQGENRLIDRICAHVDDGFAYYASIYDGADVLLIPNWSLHDDMPKCFTHASKYPTATRKDIEWLKSNQHDYGYPFKDIIRERCDLGKLGIQHGVIFTNYDKSVHVLHRFIIELRHVYE